jgi:hypothetical protein
MTYGYHDPFVWDDEPSGLCVCGHAPEDHIFLPEHPDGCQECHGSAACDCGQFRVDPRRLRAQPQDVIDRVMRRAAERVEDDYREGGALDDVSM